MDPLHFCIAIVPLAAYLMLIGGINLSPRPFVTTGGRDLAALAVAVSGFMIVGPMELFLPETIASLVGVWVWVPMLLLYLIFVVLAIMLMRPRLIIYNMTAEQLRPTLEKTIAEVDPSAEWVGDCVVSPRLGVQLAIERNSGVRNVMLTAVGSEQDLEGWYRIYMQLKTALSGNRQPPNLQGVSFLFLACVMVGAVLFSLFTGRQEIAQAFQEMLRQ